MAENSGIEWTHHTFNPWIGCTKVSPACDNCYAEDWDKRYNGGKHWGPRAPRRLTKDWQTPIKWNKKAAELGIRYRVFCASLADVFDNAVPEDWRRALWYLIKQTPNLDWLLLTKRPQNILKMLPADWGAGYPNVWLGTTVENQEEANRRIPHLLRSPAKIRFLSCEPLLGPIDLNTDNLWFLDGECDHFIDPETNVCECSSCLSGGKTQDVGIDWVIAGGESGPLYRSANPDWFRSLRDQCLEAGVPFLFKQWEGANQTVIKKLGRELDGVIWDQYPC